MRTEPAGSAAAAAVPGDVEAPEVVDLSTIGDETAWDRFVEACPDATVYHLSPWRGVFERAFGHRAVYAMARRGSRVTGVLPLIVFETRLFGRFAVSLPFVNYGGVLAADHGTREALLARAVRLAGERRLSHVELRHTGRQLPGLPARQHKVAMRLSLPDAADELWGRLDRKARNQVRKAEKSGLGVATGGAEHLDAFYRVFAENMRDLGTPVYGRSFFRQILDALPDAARIHLVSLGEAPVAAGLTIGWRGAIEVPWASSLRAHRDRCPNNLLYWHMLRHAIASGHAVFDFGRSSPGSGTFQFKRQWGAEPTPLYWEYWLRGGDLPDQSPANPKFRIAIAAWQRLPLWIANRLGPPIVRQIP